MELVEKLAPGKTEALPTDISSAFRLWQSQVAQTVAAPLLVHQHLDIDIKPEEAHGTIYGALTLAFKDLDAAGLLVQARLLPKGNQEATVEIIMPDMNYSRENALRVAKILREAARPFEIALNVEVDSDAPWYGEQA